MTTGEKLYLITGSAGFVGAKLYRLLRGLERPVLGLDMIAGDTVDFVGDIATFSHSFDEIVSLTVVHCAAMRADYGYSARDYYLKNVVATERFLSCLAETEVAHFIHISSVANFDGDRIEFSETLDCDDSYRSTKNIQERYVSDWCKRNNTPLTVLYPSAIFDLSERNDTNVGRLRRLSSKIPIFPRIDVFKSTTNLDHFVSFIVSLEGSQSPSNVLTIDYPIRTVTEIFEAARGRKTLSVNVPLLKFWLLSISFIANLLLPRSKLSIFPITRGRVIKLFRDTSYANLPSHVDTVSFQRFVR